MKYLKYVTVIFLTVILVLIGVISYQQYIGIGNGYQYNRDLSYDAHIIKNDKIIVNHTIVSLDVKQGFAVGLRKPAKYLECENGSALITRVSNDKAYFILNLKSGVVLNFESHYEFEKKLKVFGLDTKVKLDYSKFDRKWDFGDDMNISECKSLETIIAAVNEEPQNKSINSDREKMRAIVPPVMLSVSENVAPR